MRFQPPIPTGVEKWATRPRNPPVLPTVGPGRRCQRLGLPQPQAAPSRNWATWGPRRQDGLGVASHQERCPMRRRVSGTGPEVCSCGASARFPAGCCPSVVLSCVSVQTITVGRALRELRPRRPPQPLPRLTCPSPSPTTRFSYRTNRRCDIRCHKVVAVPPQGSKGRPAHAVASSEPWTNNMTRIQELLAAGVNNGLKLSQKIRTGTGPPR